MLDDDRRTAAEAFAALHIEAPEPAGVEAAAYLEASKARLVIFLLGWMGLLSVAELFMGSWLVDYAARAATGVADTAEVTLYDRVGLGLVWTRLASGIATGIVFIQWVRLVVRHARHFEFGARMPFTVETATWAWVIPLINWFRPYAVLRAMRDASQPDVFPSYEVEERPLPGGYRDPAVARERVERASVPLPVGLWWGLFVAARLSERFLHHAGGHFHDVGSVRRFAYVSLIDGGLWIAAALAAIYVVRGVLDRRAELYRRAFHWARVLRAEEAPPP